MTASEWEARARQAIQEHLVFLYGEEGGGRAWNRLRERLGRFREGGRDVGKEKPRPVDRVSERDVFLITYGDQVSEPGRAPLRTLADVLESRVLVRGRPGGITGLHILPFFPYSSDDGFSVIDYEKVDPQLGSWDDIERLGRSFRLMFDAVINHISAESAWFHGFIEGDPRYQHAFIVVDPDTDLSDVVRPRDKPLLTPVETIDGRKWVWTTFSDDQIDLNYANPTVLQDIIDVLLLYVKKGAEVIRLDAIAYVWKKAGTPSIHLEETHRVVKLLRAVLDLVAPNVILITETNVPHKENISYFGDGYDEAQMVYQFPLPPLVLHTFYTGKTRRLAQWVAELSTPSDATTFFNFLASHDGIGVRPVEAILDPSEIQALVDRTRRHGGYVSHKTNADGSKSVYELNISYFDALSDPNSEESLGLQVRRFLAAQAIMLSLAGVPGIYVHSLFGSRSYHEGVAETGRRRSINRERFSRDQLERALDDPSSLRHRVFYPYMDLIRARAAHRAFHPSGGQHVLSLAKVENESVFALVRTVSDGNEGVLCVHNVSGREQRFRVRPQELPMVHGEVWEDLISKRVYRLQDNVLSILLEPYQVLWLKVVSQ